MESNGWHEWKKHVLAEIKRLDSLDEKMYKIQLSLARLETSHKLINKILWILIGGGIGGGAVSITDLFK